MVTAAVMDIDLGQAENATERVASELLLAAVALDRFSVDMVERVMERFREMERDLVAAMIDIDFMTPRNETQRADRIEALMEIAEDIVADAYDDIIEETAADLQVVAEVAGGAAVNAFALILGAAFIAGLLLLSTKRLRAIADEARFDGATIPEWFGQQQADAMFRFRRVVMNGAANDLDTAEIIESVTGTRAAQRRDGVFQVPRRNAETLIRTAVQAVSTAAKLEFFEENAAGADDGSDRGVRDSGDTGGGGRGVVDKTARDSVLVGVSQLSTLDNRTSSTCMAYSGKRWRYPDYEPVGHSLPFAGGTPRHFHCRSQIIPLIHWHEDALGTQASMFGHVPGSWTYDTWLKSRPESEQRDILGPTKFDLWRQGKLDLTDLVDQRGNPLTVAELVRRFGRRQAE
jgi:hypothetical protein